MILSQFINPIKEAHNVGEIPVFVHIVIIILFLLLVAGVYWHKKRSRVKLPPLFYMRLSYLSNVIPSLRKIVTYPSTQIYIDFSEVQEMTQGSYMVILAQAEKAIQTGKEVFIYPKLPGSKEVLDILGKQKKYLHKNIRLTQGFLPSSEANSIIDTKIIDDMVLELRKIGIYEYFQPFYDFLIELVGNATEHGIHNKNINWWLLRYRSLQNKNMTYVFVDMGLGIVNSYKKSGLLKKYLTTKSTKIPLDALYGKLGSSTKQPNRGRGLPQIREIVEKGFVSNFVLITNNVSLQYIDNKFSVSKNPNFEGTYFTWTINKANFTQWKNLK